MAKTESTAVNELIEMVASGQNGLAEPGEDLFSSSPKPMTAARMTAPLPIIRDAVPPLPRTRAPSGTQSNVLPAVRASTAPPSRGSTIPPLPAVKQPTQRMAALPPPPGGFRTSRPSLPPPLRSTAQRPAEGTPAPELFVRPKSPTPAPASMPIAAPFEVRIDDDNPFAAQALPPVEHQKIDDSWFQSSYLVDKVELTPSTPKSGTYQVPRGTSTIALIKKLVVPTAILVLLGVCIGGYLAFNGEGGHPRKPDAQVAKAPVAAPADVAAAKPEAAKTEVAAPNTEVAAKSEAVKTDVAAPKAEVGKNDIAAKTDAGKPDAKAVATAPTTTDAAKAVAATAPTTNDAAKVAAAPTKPDAGKPDAKAVAAAAPTQIDAHGMTTIKTTRGEVKLVDILIDSKPSGATVMLVDRGKTSFLGNTPVSAAVDPSRAYDVVFTAANHSTQVEHLDPNVTHHLAIALGKPGNQAVAETHHHHHSTPAPAPAPAPAAPAPKLEAKVVAPAAKPEAKEVAKIEKPAPAKVEKAAPAKVAAPALAAAPSGTGTLMVSSKPPCDIVIDGKPTGLTTPQRSIPLSPGAHKVTFVNAGESINKTVAVVINADKPTKLIQDLMKK